MLYAGGQGVFTLRPEEDGNDPAGRAHCVFASVISTLQEARVRGSTTWPR